MQLIPLIQAIVDTQSQEVFGYEVTIRATDQGHLLTALEILQKAKHSGWLPELEIAIHAQSIAFYNDDPYLFLNVTPQTLSQRKLSFPSGTNLNRIVLEITESARFSCSIEEIAAYLRPFRDCGLQIAIDDFGTGWSNFHRLSALSPEYLKLDQSLTKDVVTNVSTQNLIDGLVSFAVKTKTTIIAEGIENKEQADWMQKLSVPLCQGFYFDIPKPIKILEPIGR